LRGDFQTDPGLSPTLFRLLDQVFPGIAAGAARLRGWGAAWEEVSTPFIHRDADGEVLAHVGLIPLPLILEGRPARAATVHAVACHPAHRRQGLYRAVMGELLEWAAPRFDTLVLTTEHPEYFTPFGFQVVEECALTVTPGGSGLRPPAVLDLDREVDRGTAHRILGAREPVSHVLGVGPERAVFLFNEARAGIRHVPELDTLVCLEEDGDTVRLFDVAAPRLPSLDELRPWLPASRRLELAFAPDRLAPKTVAMPRLFEHDGPSWLLVRGAWLPPGTPFTLPRSART
jgi:predicted N-acetyltransferase YhbS